MEIECFGVEGVTLIQLESTKKYVNNPLKQDCMTD